MTDQLADLPFDEVKRQAIELAEKRHHVNIGHIVGKETSRREAKIHFVGKAKYLR